MILTFNDLIQFMETQAKDAPLIKDSFLIQSPGLSQEEFNQVTKHFPSLPKSYLGIIKKYDVKEVTLGRYEVSVCNNKQEDFTKEMLVWNSPDDDIRQPVFKKHDLIYFGSDGFDEYVLAGTKSDYKEGEVLAIDHELYLEEQVPIVKVAPNYEMFLILAGNKYQLQLSELSYEETQAEMKRRLDALNLAPEYKEYWLR